jgi:hypothetical protein
MVLFIPIVGETGDAEENWNQRAIDALPQHNWLENYERLIGKTRRDKLKSWVLRKLP